MRVRQQFDLLRQSNYGSKINHLIKNKLLITYHVFENFCTKSIKSWTKPWRYNSNFMPWEKLNTDQNLIFGCCLPWPGPNAKWIKIENWKRFNGLPWIRMHYLEKLIVASSTLTARSKAQPLLRLRHWGLLDGWFQTIKLAEQQLDSTVETLLDASVFPRTGLNDLLEIGYSFVGAVFVLL